jgi:hypothetical protein
LPSERRVFEDKCGKFLAIDLFTVRVDKIVGFFCEKLDDKFVSFVIFFPEICRDFIAINNMKLGKISFHLSGQSGFACGNASSQSKEA